MKCHAIDICDLGARTLLGAPGLTTTVGARTLLGAPGRTTRNKKLLGVAGLDRHWMSLADAGGWRQAFGAWTVITSLRTPISADGRRRGWKSSKSQDPFEAHSRPLRKEWEEDNVSLHVSVCAKELQPSEFFCTGLILYSMHVKGVSFT